MDKLLQIDKQVFQLVNGSWSNEFFDLLMPFIRNSIFWVPLYMFLLFFAINNFKKNTWTWVLFAAGTAILANFISSDLIKENIFRLRPCNDPSLAGTIHVLVNYRPQSSSFTSSHAVNHFAMAAFFYYTLHRYFNSWTKLFFLWAFTVCFAQVYVGVHYPGDVTCGGLIGYVFGYLIAGWFNKNYNLE